MWRALKRWPDDPRLLRWKMDLNLKAMTDNLCRAMMGDFTKSLDPLPFTIGLKDWVGGPGDLGGIEGWKSISGSVVVSVTEMDPT